MSGVILDPRLFLDERSDPADGPKRGGIAVSLRTGPQRRFDLLLLVVAQPGKASGPSGFAQGLLSAGATSGIPAADRLPMNSQATCYFGLMNPCGQELLCGQTSFFQGFEIAPDASCISHALRVDQDSTNVTILCGSQ